MGVSVVAIDGPAGSGKSTVAKLLAARLDFAYLDTGAMYRSITLKAVRQGLNLEDEEVLAEMARNTRIDLQGNPQRGLKVFLDGEDVSEEIRTLEVTNQTFYIARAPKVRAVMVDLQRKIGASADVVIEGRDIGTVVFPGARFKFYLDASVQERAGRRFSEFQEKGKDVTLEQVMDDVRRRDEADFTRAVGPLKKAEDAVVIDSTCMSVGEVVETMARHVEETKH